MQLVAGTFAPTRFALTRTLHVPAARLSTQQITRTPAWVNIAWRQLVKVSSVDIIEAQNNYCGDSASRRTAHAPHDVFHCLCVVANKQLRRASSE